MSTKYVTTILLKNNLHVPPFEFRNVSLEEHMECNIDAEKEIKLILDEYMYRGNGHYDLKNGIYSVAKLEYIS
eukprot:snap_masked-scaffold_25-processed-gene-5.16-mRNA-1 protein AED:1.00 eAED:1.00 QI:0/-1/0/0/-1/1/1/0/72